MERQRQRQRQRFLRERSEKAAAEKAAAPAKKAAAAIEVEVLSRKQGLLHQLVELYCRPAELAFHCAQVTVAPHQVMSGRGTAAG